MFSILINMYVFAQHESLESGVVALWQSGETDDFYYDFGFDELDLGILTSESSLYLKSGQVTISKDSEGDIVDVDMYYRIYKQEDASGEFVNVNLPWQSEWTDAELTYQMWWNDAPDETDLNILDGLTDGAYFIEVYFSAENGDATILYLNNATNNYIAEFTYSTSTNILQPNIVSEKAFDIYPNPANEKLTLEFNEMTNVESITIINTQSSVVYQSNKSRGASGLPIEISIEELESGTYFIRVQTDQGVKVQRVIISK